MSGMIRVAEWNEHSYYLYENSADTHIIIVKDQQGKQATFNLENGHKLSEEPGFAHLHEARKFIQEFKSEFLNYWNDCKQS